MDGALQELGHSDREPLTYERAKEVCAKTNSAALVTGAIADAGNQYKLDLKAVRCDTGAVIAKADNVAEQRNLIVKQLGLAAVALRRQLGEPRTTLREFNQPLEIDTTSSIDALKANTLCHNYISAGDRVKGLKYCGRALELDPDFVLAHGGLASSSADRFDRSLSRDEYQRAYALRDRLDRRQRLLVEASYFASSLGDLAQAKAKWKDLVGTYPYFAAPHLALGGIALRQGDYQEAAAEAREAIRLSPDTLSGYGTLMYAEKAMGRYEEAKTAFEAARSHGLDGLRVQRYWLAFDEADIASMREQLKWLVDHSMLAKVAELQGDTEAYHGRMKNARRLFDEAREVTGSGGNEGGAAFYWMLKALREVWIGNSDLAERHASEALALDGDTIIKSEVALVFARSGNLATAEKLTEQLNSEYPRDTMVQNLDLPCIRAVIAIGEGDGTQAIRILQPASRYDLAPPSQVPSLCPVYVRGLAYLQANRGQDAAREFQKILDHPGIMDINNWGALAHLQLGRAYAMAGDRAKAKAAYQDFLTLWKDADLDIPIYKAAKAEYAKQQ